MFTRSYLCSGSKNVRPRTTAHASHRPCRPRMRLASRRAPVRPSAPVRERAPGGRTAILASCVVGSGCEEDTALHPLRRSPHAFHTQDAAEPRIADFIEFSTPCLTSRTHHHNPTYAGRRPLRGANTANRCDARGSHAIIPNRCVYA
jgi:hypothetical protein